MVVDFHEAIAGVRKSAKGVRKTTGGFEKGDAAVVASIEGSQVTLLRSDGTRGVLPFRVHTGFR